MSARRQWFAAAGCVLALTGGGIGALPPAHAEDAVFYVTGTRNHPAPAAQIDLTKVSIGLSNYGMAQQIPYLASLYPATGVTPLDLSVATGVAALQAAIATVPDGTRIVIVGVSQGDIVASVVEREQIAAGSTRNFLFVRVGDPSSPTGIMGRNRGIRLPGLTFVTAPDDSPWDRMIIAHQYEGLSDWPTRQENLLADLNALLGAVKYHNPWSYNVDLSTLPDSAVTVTVNAAGGTTTTYRIPATGLLPILGPLQAAGVDDRTLATLQKVIKPLIDSAYEPRPPSATTATGSTLFVASINGMTTIANRTGVALRQTQRYLDTAITKWKAARRPAPRTTPAAVPKPAPTPPPTSEPAEQSTPSTQATAAAAAQRLSAQAGDAGVAQNPSRQATLPSKGAHRRLRVPRDASTSSGRANRRPSATVRTPTMLHQHAARPDRAPSVSAEPVSSPAAASAATSTAGGTTDSHGTQASAEQQ